MAEGVDGASSGGGALGLGLPPESEEEVMVTIFMMFGVDIMTDAMWPPPEDSLEGDGTSVGDV